MHTDEYEISLSRELAVCRSTIQQIKKTLQLLEQKHKKTTALFLEELRTGRLIKDPDLREDYDAWQSSSESLFHWEDLERQYQEVYRMMKT